MGDKEKYELIKAFEEAGAKNMDFSTGFPATAIIAQVGVRMIAVTVANGVTRAVLGHGLRVAANAGLTRTIGIFAGPIGWDYNGVMDGD